MTAQVMLEVIEVLASELGEALNEYPMDLVKNAHKVAQTRLRERASKPMVSL